MNSNTVKIRDIEKKLTRTSPKDLAAKYVKRAKEKNEEISALLSVTEDLAVSQAEELSDDDSKLRGVPIVVKDNILVEDAISTGGSKILEHFRSPVDATVVEKVKEEGAIIIGKGNMDEFAMGGSTENSAFTPTKNPVDLTKVPGGSSGGPAAAVASGMVPVALGSDTGGSVRQPAAFCGVVGFKPSYGQVSRWGLMAMASSLDQIGPITNSVEDAKTVYNIIRGKDEKDATSVEVEKEDTDFDKIKIGVPEEYFVEGTSKAVKSQVNEAIDKARKKDLFEVVDISLPHTEYALACYHVIMDSEVSANMARYDGIRYGLERENSDADSMKEAYLQNRGELGEEVKRRIILGTFALSRGYYEDYYQKAQKVRKLIKADFDEAFDKVDVIATPTSPVLPFDLGEKLEDPLAMYLADMFTTSANLAGIPAISLPAGKANGLPVGLQLMGKRFYDQKLLKIAEEVESII